MKALHSVYVGQVLAERDGYRVVVTEVLPDGSYKWQSGVPAGKSK